MANAAKPLNLYFVYESGENEEILTAHDQIYESHNRFTKDSYYLEASFGKVEVGCVDVPFLTKSSHMENYSYGGDDGLDLQSAPMVRYHLGEGSYSLDPDDSRHRWESDVHPVEALAEMVATGYKASEQRPLAGFAQTAFHRAAMDSTGNTPFMAESLAHDEYEHLSWLTVFPPAMVETYGRERLLTTPAWKRMELDDGAVLLVTHEDPHDPETHGIKDVADHIGLKSYADA